jgi:hypothetical protein
MDNDGPILVRTAVPEEESPAAVRADAVANTGTQRRLTLDIPVKTLSAISENTRDLQEKLNRFVNGLNSKIQSVQSGV